jgi:hypothetical protein
MLFPFRAIVHARLRRDSQDMQPSHGPAHFVQWAAIAAIVIAVDVELNPAFKAGLEVTHAFLLFQRRIA